MGIFNSNSIRKAFYTFWFLQLFPTLIAISFLFLSSLRPSLLFFLSVCLLSVCLFVCLTFCLSRSLFSVSDLCNMGSLSLFWYTSNTIFKKRKKLLKSTFQLRSKSKTINQKLFWKYTSALSYCLKDCVCGLKSSFFCPIFIYELTGRST